MVEAIEVMSRPLQLGIMQVRFLPAFSFLTHLLPRVSPNAYIRSGDHRMHTYSREIVERKYLVLPSVLSPLGLSFSFSTSNLPLSS